MNSSKPSMASPKVLMIVHSRQLGGAERHALTLLQGLAAAGCDVALAAPASGWLAHQAAAVGVRCHAIDMRGRFDLLSAWRLARVIRIEKPDILHAHLTRSTHYAAWARGWSGHRCVLVATAHATSAHRHFDRADRVIAVSGAVAQALVAHGIAHERIVTIHHGIPDPGSIDERVDEAIPLAAPVRFGMLARFVADKGHDTAMRAISRLRERQQPAELHFAGDDATPWGREIRRLASELDLSETVVWHGRSDRPLDFLRSMDVVLVPSRREALGLTAVEALAVGRPVLASRLGGLPEVVEDGVSGALLPADDVTAWADAMEGLARDSNRRQTWGKAARRRFEEAFSLPRMVEQTCDVYRRAVASFGRELGHGR